MEPTKPTDRPMPRGAPAPPITEPPRTFANVVQPKVKAAVVERPPEVAIQSSFRQNPTAPKPMEPEKPSSEATGAAGPGGSFSASRTRTSTNRSDDVTPSPDRKAAPQPTSPVFHAVVSPNPNSSGLASSASDAGAPTPQRAEPTPAVAAASSPAVSEPAAALASPPSQVRSVKSNVTPVRSVRVSSDEQAPSEPRGAR